MSAIKHNVGIIVLGFMFLFGGIIGVVQGIELKDAIRKFENKTEQTTALVQKIELDDIGNVEHVYVAYKVGDTTYSDVELGYKVDDISEGGGLYIYYNKNNPEILYKKFYSDSADVVLVGISVLIIIMGLAFLSVGFGLTRKITKMNKIEYTAEVTDIYKDMHVKINNRHPYRVDCKVYDTYTGQTILYRSGTITRDLSNVNLKTVKVYVSEKNKKKYYVDVIGALYELNF